MNVKKWIGTVLKTVLPLLLGFYLVWLMFSSMDPETWETFVHELSHANYFWIVLSLLISFGGLLSRAYRWKYALEPLGYHTSLWTRYHAMMIGYVMNLTIPRAGEATRAAMLYRSDGVPFATSAGTIIGERAVDVLMLFLIAFSTALFSADDFWMIRDEIKRSVTNSTEPEHKEWLQYLSWALIGLAITGFLTVIFIERLRTKVAKFFRDVLKGVAATFKSGNPAAYALHTVLIWASYVTYFCLAFFSLKETSDLSFSALMLAFIAGSLGITFTNGGIGAFPLVVGLVVSFYLGNNLGPEKAQGVGFAIGMLIWSSQTLLVIILGVLSLFLIPKNFKADAKHPEKTGA